jgi:hypothetical protein
MSSIFFAFIWREMWSVFYELHLLFSKAMFSDGDKFGLYSMTYIFFALRSMFSDGEKCGQHSLSYIFFALIHISDGEICGLYSMSYFYLCSKPCFQMERNVDCLLWVTFS